MKPGEFVTSDHHFCHENVIRYSNRPFKDAEEMEWKLIEAWNNKVPSGSIVYHLGDIAFAKSSKIENIVSRLNGTIRLIRGNHDKSIKGSVCDLFEWVKDYYETSTPDGIKIVMCHYPLLTWNKAHRGSWHLHGHSHNNLKVPSTTRLDIGVDTRPDYAPYSYDEVVNILSKRKYLVVDHHEPEHHDSTKED